MMIPIRIILAMPQKNLILINNIAKGPWLGQSGLLPAFPADRLGRSDELISSNKFEEVISELPMFSSGAQVLQNQVIPILQSSDPQSYPPQEPGNPSVSWTESSPNSPLVWRYQITEPLMVGIADQAALGRIDLFSLKESGMIPPPEHSEEHSEGVLKVVEGERLLFEPEARVLRVSVDSASDSPQTTDTAHRHYPLTLKDGSHQGLDLEGRYYIKGGDDLNNKPGQKIEAGTLFQYPSDDGMDFSKTLMNSRSDTPQEISTEGYINVNDTHRLKEIADLFFQKSLHLVKEDASSIRINIKEDYLGRLKLDISIRDNMVKAEIVTEYPQIRKMIELNQGQLRDALSQHGLEISSLSVSIEGDKSGFFSQKDIRNSSPAFDYLFVETPKEDNNMAIPLWFDSDRSINIFA